MSLPPPFSADWLLDQFCSHTALLLMHALVAEENERRAMTASELVYPLAFPKSVSHKCEICGKTATRMCSRCRVTYYCSEDHQTADSVGIHEKICSSLASLRSKQTFLPSEEERVERDREIRDRKIHLTDVTRMIGEKHVSRTSALLNRDRSHCIRRSFKITSRRLSQRHWPHSS